MREVWKNTGAKLQMGEELLKKYCFAGVLCVRGERKAARKIHRGHTVTAFIL